MKHLQCKINLNLVATRFVYANKPVEPTTSTKELNNKGEYPLSDKSIDNACKKQGNSKLNDLQHKDLKNRLLRARNSDKDFVRRFVMATRTADDAEEICELQEQALEEVQILQTNNESVAPWKELISKHAKHPKYDEARKKALELKKSAGKDGKDLVKALNTDDKLLPASFVNYADLLLKGTPEQKIIIREQLAKSDQNLDFRLKIELNLLSVKNDESAASEVKIKGVSQIINTEKRTAVKKEEPLSEYGLFRTNQLRDANKKLQAANKKYTPLQDGLRGFVENELEVGLEAKSDQDLARFFESQKVYLEGANGASNEQKLQIIIKNYVLDGAFYDQGDTDKIFLQKWKHLHDLGQAYGVKVKMSSPQKEKILKELHALGEINKVKHECEPHLAVLRKMKTEQNEVYSRQEAEARQLYTRRTDTGLGELPNLMDREGNYKAEVEANIPLIITEDGKTFKVQLSRLINEGQTEEGQKERLEAGFSEKDRRVKGETFYEVNGVDAEGQPYKRRMGEQEFLEYVKVNNVRRDFSELQGKAKFVEAQNILKQQIANLANLKLEKGFTFVHTFNQAVENNKPTQVTNKITIKSVDEADGTITLDHGISLFAKSSFKRTTRQQNKDPQVRRAGTKVELGEFLGWLVRENVAEYIEETDADSGDESDSILNRRLREDHASRLATEAESTESTMPVSKALQIGKDWQVVSSNNTGQVYVVRRNPKNISGIDIAEVEKSKPTKASLGNSGPEAQHLNNTPWRVTGKPKNLHVTSALHWIRDKEIEPVDAGVEVARARQVDFGNAPTDVQSANDNEIATVNAINQQKRAIEGALNDYQVNEQQHSMAAMQKDSDATVSAGTLAEHLPAEHLPGGTQAHTEKAEEEANLGNADEQSDKTDEKLSVATLNLSDPKQMSYSQIGFMQRMWMNTTFLNNADIFEMGKHMYEYMKRRWDRNTKNRFSKVGKNIPFFTTEMDRINQNAETEEMQQFKDAMDNWGVWQVEEALYTTNNRDQAKACLIVLSEKGKIRWENTKLWAVINRFTETQYFVPVPKNGDAQMKDPRTGKTGIELLPAAIDSLWGQGQYNDWSTQSSSKYQSKVKEYAEEGKQLEHDPYNNGSISGRLSQILKEHKAGNYVDNQEFEGLLHYAFEAGKSTFENKFYFIVAGVTEENARGETILTWDRLGSLDSEYLNRLPWLDFFTNKDIKRSDGTTTGWNREDLRLWMNDWKKHSAPGKEYQGDGNKALWDFLWKKVLNNSRTIIRNNKGLRNAENMDHDDAHFIIPLANEMMIDTVLKGPTGGKKYFTMEGYANAYGGYAELVKARSTLHPPQPNLVFNLVKSFVRYDAILSNRLHKDEKSRYARMDTGDWSRGSVVSPNVNTGVHRQQMQELITAICGAYGYDASNLFKDLPQGDQYRNEQREIDDQIINFGATLQKLVQADGDGGKKMLEVTQNFVDKGSIYGLAPNENATALREAASQNEDKSLGASF